MKKLICIIMCLSIALCFASCAAKGEKGSDETNTQDLSEASSQSESTSASAVQADSEILPEKDETVGITVLKDKEKFSLGKIKDNNYVNKSAGFKITGLGKEWVRNTPQQISLYFDSGIDPDTGRAYSPNSTDGSQNYLYDVMYTNKVTDEIISVSLLEYSGETGLSDEIPIGDSSSDIEGFNDKEELIYLKFAGKKVSCKKIRYTKVKNIEKMPDLTEYEIYMMSSDYSGVIRIVVVCFDGQPDIDDILKHFSATE